LRDRWLSGAEAVGLGGVGLYEDAKHSMATGAVRSKVLEHYLQSLAVPMEPHTAACGKRNPEEAAHISVFLWVECTS
jgi:hypothetical protein